MKSLVSLVLAVAVAAAAPTIKFAGAPRPASPWRVCSPVRIVDGDTLRCGSERVRLLGIDAPELHGCPRNRHCAPGDGKASLHSLQLGADRGPVSLLPVTVDRYGRTVAVAKAGPVNLSCWQLKWGGAIYKPQWDNGGRIAAAC